MAMAVQVADSPAAGKATFNLRRPLALYPRKIQSAREQQLEHLCPSVEPSICGDQRGNFFSTKNGIFLVEGQVDANVQLWVLPAKLTRFFKRLP